MTDSPISQEKKRPNFFYKAIILLLLAGGVAMAFYAKNRPSQSETTIAPEKPQTAQIQVGPPAEAKETSDTATTAAENTGQASEKPASLPRLIELGSVRCIPCRMMAPILEELKKEYDGKLKVEFIDVWEIPSAAEQFRVRAIPTQVILDSSGKEVFRHTGFYPKEELVSKLKELKLIP